MTITVTIEATSPEELHAKVLGLIGRSEMPFAIKPPGTPPNPLAQAYAARETPLVSVAEALGDILKAQEPEQPTAEVVPIAERKKPGRPKKAETVIEAESAKNPEPTVEDARAVLKDIQTKIGNEEARQLNKKHGEEPLSEKKPAQWAAIIAEGKTLLAALEE